MSWLLLSSLLLWVWCVPAWADVQVRVARVAAATSTGTQDITVADWGVTPTAAFLWMTNAVTNATAINDAFLGVGLTDCTNAIAVGGTVEHNVATQNSDRRTADAGEILQVLNPDAVVDGEAIITGCIANGIRIEWTNAPSAAVLIQAVFFAGTDLSAFVGTFTSHADLDGTVDVTAPGFQPDDVLLVGASGSGLNTTAGWDILCVGLAVNTAAPFQGGVGFFQEAGLETNESQALLSTTYGCQYAYTSSPSIEIGGWDSQGFTATTRVFGAARVFGYLALKYAGAIQRWAGAVATPAVAGVQGYTAPGFAPQAVVLFQSLATTVDTIMTSGSASATVGLAAFTASEAFSCAVTSADGQETSDTQSRCDAQAAWLPNEDGTRWMDATVVSLDATGWTLDFDAVADSVRYWVGWAIGANPTGAALPGRLLLR